MLLIKSLFINKSKVTIINKSKVTIINKTKLMVRIRVWFIITITQVSVLNNRLFLKV